MKDSIVAFCHQHCLRLPERDVDDWRPLPGGTYTHRSLPYGPMRDGITNGVVCFMATGDTLVYVHLLNMDVILDPKPSRPSSKQSPDKPRKPKKSRYPFDVL